MEINHFFHNVADILVDMKESSTKQQVNGIFLELKNRSLIKANTLRAIVLYRVHM